MLIPIYSFAEPDIGRLTKALTAHGIVIVDVLRTQAGPIRVALSRAILGESPAEDGPHVLHLSCAVEPVMEHGWVEFFTYSPVYEGTPAEATELVGAAVRQWGEKGKPDTFMARLGSGQPHDGGWRFRFDRWELVWGHRVIAIAALQSDGTVLMTLNAMKMWQVKHVRAPSMEQAKRYAERWCAARLLPELPTKVGAMTLRGHRTHGSER